MPSDKPKVVLITSGLSPAAQYFASLPGLPVGIINWNNHPVENTEATIHAGAVKKIKNRLIAKIRKRAYASLPHLCSSNALEYADIYKRDENKLAAILSQWECDLVITSRCSFVPTAALAKVRLGAINLHPSWLPDYRGAEPMLWHLVENKDYVAASVHVLTDDYDQGSVLAQKKIQRPRAASKAVLSSYTETQLGRELLSSVIQQLIDTPDIKGVEQPAESRTRYARRETPETFAQNHSINEFDGEIVWDLLHYFGCCPNQWLDLPGWRGEIQWRPVNKLQKKRSTDKSAWTAMASGMNVELHNNETTIKLKPQYKSVLKRLRK